MDTARKIAFKTRLKLFCIKSIEERIMAVKTSMKNAQEAANSEEKSSAGDKYETGRAMGHLQKDMHARQLDACLREKADLQAVNADMLYDHAVGGAFIQTDGPGFFIAAGIGKQTIEGIQVFFISPKAPLAVLLLNIKKGHKFLFNKVELLVLDLF